MDQVRGSLLDWATRWQASLTPAGLSEFNSEVESLLNTAACTTRLADPFRVVLAGPPNVGKSSLLNSLVGFDRSITLNLAGTTRDVLHANTVIAGLPVRLSDTAGIRESDEEIEREGIRKAQQAVREADLLLLVCEPLPNGAFSDLLPIPGTTPQLRILNKMDLQSNEPTLSRSLSDRFDASTNALTGEGLIELMAKIADKLGQHLPESGKPALINQRQWKIMEQCSTAGSLERKSQLLKHLVGHNNG
jgi:tRNA modification GTPase